MPYLPDNVWVEVYTLVAGLPTWTNIGGDIVSTITVNTGFSDGDQLSRLASGGDMRFDLDNTNSAYNPSSTFYKGQKIRLRVKYGSLVKTKFFGYIDHIGLDVGTISAQQAHVVCVDWLALAAITPIRALPTLTNTTIDAAVRVLLTQMQTQPEALDIESGNIILPTVFDQVTVNSTIYSELQNLVMGEWGYIYMRDGGSTLKVENSYSRIGDGSDYKTTTYYHSDGVATDLLLEDGTTFLLEDSTTLQLEGEPTTGTFDSNLGSTYTNIDINHGDNLVNQISETDVPVIIGGSTVTLYPFDIASGSKAILIPTNSASAPYVLQGQYKDPTAGGAQISGTSVITPVVVTDWKFNSAADGTGTDLSGNITFTFTAGASGFKALIVNTGAAGYLTKWNVRGTAIYRYNPVETTYIDQRSIWDYGNYSLQFTRQYGQNPDSIRPFMFRLLMRDRKPRTIYSNPKFNAYDTDKHMGGFMALDIGDQIRLTSSKPVSDALYYIQGVRFTVQPGGEAISFDYVTTETLAGAIPSVTEAAVEQTLKTQGVNFGYLPSMLNHTQRTITARVYLHPTSANNQIFTIGQKAFFYIDNISRLFFQKIYSGTSGLWTPTTGTISSDVWVNLAISYDQSLVSNVPIIYINGSAVAVTTSSPPSGTPDDEAGGLVTIGSGNDIVAVGAGGFSGKFENIAEYNRILTAAEITTIHNGGTRLAFASYPQTGLKFFFGGMDNDTYSAKLNAALGSLDTVYDLVNGFTGQPINSPILRAVG